MYTDDFYEVLMERHDADRIVERASRQLAEEAAARRKFREWLTPSVKAEFIGGEIIMHSPAKRRHLRSSGSLHTILNTYVEHHEIGEIFVEKALVEVGRNDFEPDLAYWTSEQTQDWTDDTDVFPPPTLVVEILSKSTAGRDRGVKFESYLTQYVPEYWIVDPVRELIEQYTLRLDKSDTPHYDLIDRFHGANEISCRVIAGLHFPAAAAFSKRQALIWVRQLLAAQPPQQ